MSLLSPAPAPSQLLTIGQSTSSACNFQIYKHRFLICSPGHGQEGHKDLLKHGDIGNMQHSHITLVTAKCFQVDNCAEAWLWYLICLWSVGKGAGRTGLQLNIVSDVFMFNDYPSVYDIAK